jgi:competence protein ComEA
LELIPGVGNVTAQRIIQYRDHLGGYTSLEQLMEISGIGEGTYAELEPYLVVGEE